MTTIVPTIEPTLEDLRAIFATALEQLDAIAAAGDEISSDDVHRIATRAGASLAMWFEAVQQGSAVAPVPPDAKCFKCDDVAGPFISLGFDDRFIGVACERCESEYMHDLAAALEAEGNPDEARKGLEAWRAAKRARPSPPYNLRGV